jgi:hypothetical protein
MKPAVYIDAGAKRRTAMQTDQRKARRRADPEGGTPKKNNFPYPIESL